MTNGRWLAVVIVVGVLSASIATAVADTTYEDDLTTAAEAIEDAGVLLQADDVVGAGVALEAAGVALGSAAGKHGTDPTTTTTTTTTVPPSCGFTDTFDAALSGDYTEVDPIGDGTVSVSGGLLNLALPAGQPNHDNWTNGTPINRTLRVIRSVGSCTDWTLETKIQNTDTHAGKFGGFLVQADADNFFRSDWDGDGTHVDLFVGVWNGTAPFSTKFNASVTTAAVQWQRIVKSGTTYTISTSLNGTAWTQRVQFTWTPTPTVVGLNVGNSTTNPPAYTAQYDYLSLN